MVGPPREGWEHQPPGYPVYRHLAVSSFLSSSPFLEAFQFLALLRFFLFLFFANSCYLVQGIWRTTFVLHHVLNRHQASGIIFSVSLRRTLLTYIAPICAAALGDHKGSKQRLCDPVLTGTIPAGATPASINPTSAGSSEVTDVLRYHRKPYSKWRPRPCIRHQNQSTVPRISRVPTARPSRTMTAT